MPAETVTLVSATVATVTLLSGPTRINEGKLRIADVSGTPVDIWITVGDSSGATPADPVADAADAILVNVLDVTGGYFEMDVAPGVNKLVVKLLQVGTQKVCVYAF